MSTVYNSIVMVKQVPDTAGISGQVMRPDGTVNRSKLPAIFNPEDKVALEMALRVRDKYAGKVTVITMGPTQASEVLRECLYLGADEVYLISDRNFAGADTLATSYVLSKTIEKIGNYQLIFAGRQAIDGDTAQVGPQTAEKLNIPQITCTEEIIEISENSITAKRITDTGYEILESSLPVLITVIKDAAEPRPFGAKRVMAFKGAKSLSELEKITEKNPVSCLEDLKEECIARSLYIPTIAMDNFSIDPTRCGLKGSPTRVYKIESVVLAGGEPENIEPTKSELSHLIDSLMKDHIFG